MEDFVSFDNKILHLLNPLPPITVAELHKRAGVTLRKPRQGERQVFDLELRWGGGEDLKTHTLRPGQSIRMQEKQAREIVQDFKPVGGGICGTNPGLASFGKEEERTAAIIEALHIAEQHYHTIGAGQIDSVQGARGHSEAQVQQYKSSVYGTYYLAMAKEAVIREAREKLEQKATNGKG